MIKSLRAIEQDRPANADDIGSEQQVPTAVLNFQTKGSRKSRRLTQMGPVLATPRTRLRRMFLLPDGQIVIADCQGLLLHAGIIVDTGVNGHRRPVVNDHAAAEEPP